MKDKPTLEEKRWHRLESEKQEILKNFQEFLSSLSSSRTSGGCGLTSTDWSLLIFHLRSSETILKKIEAGEQRLEVNDRQESGTGFTTTSSSWRAVDIQLFQLGWKNQAPRGKILCPECERKMNLAQTRFYSKSGL